MKHVTVPLALLVLVAALVGSAQEDPVKTLMRAKAGYAHCLLDAVVQEDFETMEEQAFRLKAVAGTADWNVIDTPEYAKESDSFVRATEKLETAARECNGEAAALAYMDVTLKCVHCHRYLKTYRSARD